MQRTRSHSRTQRGALCPALSPRRRPNPSRPARQPARPPCVLGARGSAPQTDSPTPPSGPWPPRLETGGERWNRVSERGESGPLSFPLRPSNKQSLDPCARPRPRAQPPAAKELWPNFCQTGLLLSASESFSQRTFSFDSERERFAVTERAGSRSSAGSGAPLLSALGACLPRPQRACGEVGARGWPRLCGSLSR